ncbi:Rnf-Nqr domain containing protein [Pseudothermotoga thermarum]|uniref:RnfA-Nqr electron transport subunit n=1 Tax=Pseudothermotoga thermarum DSM 5069 TaxID=688269 RepID=F7YTJ7_9THEM|nr:Rnf-Nqr domain containing protein [Pseudothermotoga thermarum]AEH51214.1 RnfA-Nqr electron transport subunit [Pseudothermotoga thermarum DSM 5069]
MSEFSKIAKKNILYENQILVQILGICSTLAVTNKLLNTLIMAVGVTFVTGLSNLTVSLLRNFLPRKARMMIETLIIASYVIVIDIILKAYLPDVSKALGPYVGLIITNCIIMGRTEAFGLSNSPILSLWDGLTAGFGYMWVLMLIAFIRELLGFGTVFNVRIMPVNFTPWTIMVMAPSAFFLLGIMIWFFKSLILKVGEKK